MKPSITAPTAALILWLAGCATEPAPTQTAIPSTGDPITAQAFPEPTLPTTAPSSAATQGYWSATKPWPLVSIHAILLPNGNILTFDMQGDSGSNANDGSNITFNSYDNLRGSWDSTTGDWRRVSLWNMRAGEPTSQADLNDPNRFQWVNNLTTNLFCAGQILLADGRAFVVGGHFGLGPFTGSPPTGRQDIGGGKKDTNIFDWRTNQWTLDDNMRTARWYPTATILGNGDVMVAGGNDEAGTTPSNVEIWSSSRSLGSRWRNVGGDVTSLYWPQYYPRLFTAPNGQVFYAGLDSGLWTVNTIENGGVDKLDFVQSRDGFYRNYGNAAMFDDGRILVTGGQQLDNTYTRTSYVIDVRNGTGAGQAVVTRSGDMARGRWHDQATILADGSVLVSGGNSSPDGDSNVGDAPGASAAQLQARAMVPERWNPATGQWANMATMTQSRQYHSVALLLPDGRVFTAGAGGCTRQGCPDLSDRSAEFFWPPYLFNSDGTLARRPRIVSAPSTAQFGKRIRIGTPDASSIARVEWIRLGAVTHSYNMNQRAMSLSFTRSGDTVLVNAPSNPNSSPPGHYMLFLLNANGTPSMARIIRIGN